MAWGRTRRWGQRLVLSLIALSAGFGIGLLALGYTPVLAALCPGCFGFQTIGPNVFSEANTPAADQEFLRRLALAETRVSAAFGPMATDKRPRIFLCYTQTCNTVMGGHQARALTYGAQLFYLGPTGHDTEIIAHEWAHVALHRQIGVRALRHFPAWVDEGIATYVSRDPRFDLNPVSCDPGAGALPQTAAEWRHSDGAREAVFYGQAGCRVAQWVRAHPVSGLEGLFAMRLSAG